MTSLHIVALLPLLSAFCLLPASALRMTQVRRAVQAGTCFVNGTRFVPDIAGADRSFEDGPEACQARCARVDSCRYCKALRGIAKRVLDTFEKAGCNKGTNIELTEDQAAALDTPVTTYKPFVTTLPVFYISNNETRERAFLDTFHMFTPHLNKVSAVNGSSDPRIPELIQNVTPVAQYLRGHRKTGPKVVGCLLSHLIAIRDAWFSDADVVLILEDDVIPLYPAWRMTLEEYVTNLPYGWQASQVQWTAASMDRKVNDTLAFEKGQGWGTGAYLLHRRGMERVMRTIWNSKVQKFDLGMMHQNCVMFSADDCLLGFSDSESRKNTESVKWVHGKRMLMDAYRAQPPLFVHASVRSWMHKFNFCADVETAFRIPHVLPGNLAKCDGGPLAGQLLVFAPMGNSSLEREQVLRNMQALPCGADTFLAYKNWRLEGDCSSFACPADGASSVDQSYVMRLLRSYWAQHRAVWLKQYRYVWVVGGDVDITEVNVTALVHTANDTQAELVAPSLSDSRPGVIGSQVLRRFQSPRSDCRFRYTSYVEAAAPMMRPESWGTLLDNRSADVEGPDASLCGLLAEQQQQQRQRGSSNHRPSRHCALVDAAPATRSGRSDWDTDAVMDRAHRQGAEASDGSFLYHGHELHESCVQN